MPYVFGEFNEATVAAFATAATELASKSSFVPNRCFQVSLIDALDQHTDTSIMEAVSAVAKSHPQQEVRFARWQVTQTSLTVLLELDPAVAALERSLCSWLPRGQATPLAVTVGSIEAIPQEYHAAFLEAVQAGFPITSHSTGRLVGLAYENDDPDKPNPPAVALEGSPDSELLAPPPQPAPQPAIQAGKTPSQPASSLRRPSATKRTAVISTGVQPMELDRTVDRTICKRSKAARKRASGGAPSAAGSMVSAAATSSQRVVVVNQPPHLAHLSRPTQPPRAPARQQHQQHQQQHQRRRQHQQAASWRRQGQPPSKHKVWTRLESR